MRIGQRVVTLVAIAMVGSLAVGSMGAGAPTGAESRATGTAALGPSAAAPPAQAHLRIGLLPITANLDLFLARERGIFTEEGLSAELTAMAGGAEILPALIGGSLDVGTINVVTHVLAEDQGFRAKAVANPTAQGRGDPVHAILVRADSPIQGARDLEGRTMATNTLNNIDHIMQQVWVRQRGGDPRRVNFLEVPFPQMPAALAQGRVDAIGPTEPFVTVAASQGARVLAYHYKDVNEVTLLAYYGATDDWLGRNADLARRFHRVSQRANEYLAANPDEQRAAAVRLLNMTPDLANRVAFPEILPRVDPALIQWWIDTVRSLGQISGSPNPQDMIYDTVR
jgi:NitT/TauT family transport system substrate-binding protein